MRIEDFSTRAAQPIAMADGVLATKFEILHSTYVEAGALAGFRSASLSFLHNVFGPDHPYYRTFEERLQGKNFYTSARSGREIIVAAKAEIEGGWSQRVRSLVSAEIFADLLEMADYLLTQGYKDAAAVMIGSTLEEHLRELCRKHGIAVELTKDGKTIPKKADALNAELAAANVYNKLDQKNVTAFLDLRNKAAHGHYTEYSDAQVRSMYMCVADFIARVAL